MSGNNDTNNPLKLIALALPLIIFVALAGFLLRALFSDPTELSSALIGKKAPEFVLPDIYDVAKKHDEQVLSGDVMLLNVWATWCPTCRAEHEFLNELAAQDIKIIGLNYKDDSREKAVNWLNALGDPYAINLFDEEGDVAIEFGVYGAPETFIIDSDGTIYYRHVGDVNERNWRSTLLPIYQCLQRGGGDSCAA